MDQCGRCGHIAAMRANTIHDPHTQDLEEMPALESKMTADCRSLCYW